MISSRSLSAVRFLLSIIMSSQTNNQSLIERLFGAGAHFGFKKSRRHPSIAPFLFGTKEGNDIFDLETTSTLIENTKLSFVKLRLMERQFFLLARRPK